MTILPSASSNMGSPGLGEECAEDAPIPTLPTSNLPWNYNVIIKFPCTSALTSLQKRFITLTTDDTPHGRYLGTMPHQMWSTARTAPAPWIISTPPTQPSSGREGMWELLTDNCWSSTSIPSSSPSNSLLSRRRWGEGVKEREKWS